MVFPLLLDKRGAGIDDGEGGGAVAFSLPFSDDFNRADGAIGGNWTGATWTIDSNAAKNTPSEGGELLTNGNLETWASPTDLASWAETIAGSSTINQETTTVHGGSNAARMDIDASNNNALIVQTPGAGLAVGDWFVTRLWAQANAASKSLFIKHNNQAQQQSNKTLANGTYGEWALVSRVATLAGISVQVGRLSATSASLYIDDISTKELTLASLFATIPATVSDVTVKGAWTVVQGTLAGVIANLDDPDNPQNFVLCLVNGIDGNIYLWKCVAGVYTQVLSAANTYSAGANVELRKSGTTYQVFYNGSQVGANQTISDAGIVDNTIHGVFSTWGGNSLDSFFAE